MKIALIRFRLRAGARRTIPWHFSFYKDILLRSGFEVDIIDDQVENLGVAKLAEIVIERGYDLVGTGGIGSAYLPLRDFCSEVKAKRPEAFIVPGGQIVADWAFILESCKIDAVAQGEGEITLEKLAKAIDEESDWRSIPGIAYRRDGKNIENPPEELIGLDELPPYHFGHIDVSKYDTTVPDSFLVDEHAKELKAQGQKFLYVFTARGCPYNCFFCYRHIKGYRTYSPEKLDEMFSFLTRQGFRFFAFGDECITAKKSNLKNICELAKKYGFYWTSSGRADQVSPSIMAYLKEHNCKGLQIGVESFDQDMLTAMRKKTTPQQNIDAMNLCYEYGLQTVLQLVIGMPGEDRKTILNTRRGLWSCHFRHADVAVAILNPYPGSPAYWYGLEKGIIKNRGKVHQQFADKGEIVVNFSKLGIRELAAWRDWIPCEATLSNMLKERKFGFNRELVSKVRCFLRSYIKLLPNPLAFMMFNVYLLRGASHWFASAPKPNHGVNTAELEA